MTKKINLAQKVFKKAASVGIRYIYNNWRCLPEKDLKKLLVWLDNYKKGQTLEAHNIGMNLPESLSFNKSEEADGLILSSISIRSNWIMKRQIEFLKGTDEKR